MLIYNCYFLRLENIRLINTNTFVDLKFHNIIELYNLSFVGAYVVGVAGIYFGYNDIVKGNESKYLSDYINNIYYF